MKKENLYGLLKDIFVPLFSVALGAYLAYSFTVSQESESSKKALLAELKSNKSVIENILNKNGDSSSRIRGIPSDWDFISTFPTNAWDVVKSSRLSDKQEDDLTVKLYKLYSDIELFSYENGLWEGG